LLSLLPQTPRWDYTSQITMATAHIASDHGPQAGDARRGSVSPTARRIAAVACSLWIVVSVAMVLRLAYAWDQARELDPQVLTSRLDLETGHIANSLLMGRGFSSPQAYQSGPTAWLTPIYPLLIAAIFRIFGVGTLHAFYAAVFMNMIFSAATCIPIFYLGKRLAGIGLAAGASWTWALLPNAIMLPFGWVWDTSLTALLVALLLWDTVRVAESKRWRDWCGYGLLWGFTLMVNPAPSVLLPFWLAWLAYKSPVSARQGWRARLARPALSAAVAVLCCVPWTVRNYRALHEFVPLRSNLGLELYIGNNENYEDPLHPRVWPNLITREKEFYRFYRMGEMPFMHEEMRKAVSFIVEHPRVEVGLTLDRVVEFWTGTPAPIQDLRRIDSAMLLAVAVCTLLGILGTVGGIVVLIWRRSPYAFLLGVSPVVFPLLYYATHGSLRYRHPLDPVIVILSTIAATALLQPVGAAVDARRTRSGS
jgi:Dolichyl-phosphate-mannose-protein mannosyltransferase